MLTLIAKFFKLLNSEVDPRQIALAIALALIPALTPIFSLHNILILFAIAILRVNLMAFIVALMVFKPLGFVLSPLTNIVGFTVLTNAGLEPIFTTMYNIAIFKLSNFNNTHLMGGLIISIVLFIPIYFIATKLINSYRDKFLEKVNQYKIVQFIKASKFYSIYTSLKGLHI